MPSPTTQPDLQPSNARNQITKSKKKVDATKPKREYNLLVHIGATVVLAANFAVSAFNSRLKSKGERENRDQWGGKEETTCYRRKRSWWDTPSSNSGQEEDNSDTGSRTMKLKMRVYEINSDEALLPLKNYMDAQYLGLFWLFTGFHAK